MFDESDIPAGYHDADLEMMELARAADDLDDAHQEQTAERVDVVEGQLYQYDEGARCDGCRQWWRKRVECRYVDVRAAGESGYPYQTMRGERVRDLTDWERSKTGTSSFSVWSNYDWEKPERVQCPDCRAARIAAAAALTLDDLDDDAPQTPPDAPRTDEEHFADLVPASFIADLDTRLGTADVVELLKAAIPDKPKGANWNNLANRATIAALDLKRAAAGPTPGEQLTLA